MEVQAGGDRQEGGCGRQGGGTGLKGSRCRAGSSGGQAGRGWVVWREEAG